MEKKKKLFICLLSVILLVIIVLLMIVIFSKNKISDLEIVKVKEVSFETMMYLDDYKIDKESYDKYILYALEYSYNENGKDTLGYNDIKNIIESRFNINITDEMLDSIGTTPSLLDNHVMHFKDSKEYFIDKKIMTQELISEIPIITYNIKKIEKKKNGYIVTYDRYKVENPYEILNYYNDKEEKSDTSKILDYLKCKGSIRDIKVAVNKDNISEIGNVDKTIKVVYVLKNDKLLIDSVK